MKLFSDKWKFYFHQPTQLLLLLQFNINITFAFPFVFRTGVGVENPKIYLYENSKKHREKKEEIKNNQKL